MAASDHLQPTATEVLAKASQALDDSLPVRRERALGQLQRLVDPFGPKVKVAVLTPLVMLAVNTAGVLLSRR